jgi:hypothetical protein
VRLAAIVVASLLVVSCGGKEDPKRVEAAGVSVLIPGGWRVVDPREALTSPDTRAIERANPEFGEQLRRLEHPSNPLKLLAFAPGRSAGSISVFVFRAKPRATPDQFARTVSAQLSRVPGFRQLRRVRGRVAGGEAVELWYMLPYRSGTRLVQFQTLQVLLIRGGREYAVTYAGDPETFSANESVFRKSIASLRISPRTRP